MLHTNLSQWETLHAPHRAGRFLCLKFANFISELKEVIHTVLHVVYSMQSDVLSKKSGNVQKFIRKAVPVGKKSANGTTFTCCQESL